MRVDPLYHLGLPNALNDIVARENTLTQQLSSGLRVATASDDPTAAAESVRLGSAIAADDAYTKASSGLESRLQVADSALGNVVTSLTSAITLAVKGSDGTLDAANVQAIGAQLADLRDQVLALANTAYAGSYLFSGTAAGTQPFALGATGVVYSGDSQTQYAATPGGQKLAVSVAGSAIFSASGADVFASLNNLVADFTSGAASASTPSDLEALRAGLANVSTQRGTLDASLNALQQTSTYAGTDEANLQAAQSALVATDSTAFATDLSSAETQQKALLSVLSAIGKEDLFDYLQ